MKDYLRIMTRGMISSAGRLLAVLNVGGGLSFRYA